MDDALGGFMLDRLEARVCWEVLGAFAAASIDDGECWLMRIETLLRANLSDL